MMGRERAGLIATLASVLANLGAQDGGTQTPVPPVVVQWSGSQSALEEADSADASAQVSSGRCATSGMSPPSVFTAWTGASASSPAAWTASTRTLLSGIVDMTRVVLELTRFAPHNIGTKAFSDPAFSRLFKTASWERSPDGPSVFCEMALV